MKSRQDALQTTFSDKNRMRQSARVRVCTGGNQKWVSLPCSPTIMTFCAGPDVLASKNIDQPLGKYTLEIDLAFPHSYETERLPELPGTGKFDVPVLYFPVPKNRPEHNGLWLKMTPATAKPWVGVFKFLFDSPHTFSRVVSTPDPDCVYVISGSGGYIVKVDKPEMWETIVIPVLSVRLFAEHQLLVFADFTSLAAYGKNGLIWRSPRLCWDELKILNMTHDTIKGTGYDPTHSISNESRFAVDIVTGRSLLSCPTTFTDGKPAW